MHRDARHHHQDQLLRSLYTDTIAGDRPQDILDLHDITVRLRRWFGAFGDLDTRNRVGRRAPFRHALTGRRRSGPASARRDATMVARLS